MGISIDVVGLLWTGNSGPGSMPTIREALKERNLRRLRAICSHFGWVRQPWQEIDEEAVFDSSITWSSYFALMEKITALKVAAADIGQLSTIRTSNGNVIFLPIDFPDSFALPIEDAVFVGSSPCLLKELLLVSLGEDDARDLLLEAAQASIGHNLPLLLRY